MGDTSSSFVSRQRSRCARLSRYPDQVRGSPRNNPAANSLRASGQSLRRRLNRDDLESVRLAVFPSDRDIFAGPENVVAEAIAGLVVIFSRRVVVEHPAGMLGAARLVHQASDLIILAAPESAHAAMLAMLAPQVGIDVPACVERGDKLIAVPVRAQREVL